MAGVNDRGRPVADATLRAALAAIARQLGGTVVLAAVDRDDPARGAPPRRAPAAFHVTGYTDAAAFLSIRRDARRIFPPASFELIWHPGAPGMLAPAGLQLGRQAPEGRRVVVKVERTPPFAENRAYVVLEVIALPDPGPGDPPQLRNGTSKHR